MLEVHAPSSWLFVNGDQSIHIARPEGRALIIRGPGISRQRREFDDEEALQRYQIAMAEQLAAVGHTPTGFVVQRMVPDGVEMIVGLVQDPSFGPVLACGAGGITAELTHDVSVRLTPLSERDPAEMIGELKTYPLLCGYRGAPPCERAALEDILRRLATLAEDLPQLMEMDCNPVKVTAYDALIVDARIRVAPVEAPRPLGARR